MAENKVVTTIRGPWSNLFLKDMEGKGWKTQEGSGAMTGGSGSVPGSAATDQKRMSSSSFLEGLKLKSLLKLPSLVAAWQSNQFLDAKQIWGNGKNSPNFAPFPL